MAPKLNFFDSYSFKARILPAIFTIFTPIFIFNNFYTSPELSKLIGSFSGSEVISNLTISTVFLFYFSQFGRLLGITLFEKRFFQGELNMPTTNFMLYSNTTYTRDFKIKFAEKVKKDFGYNLSSESEEKIDENTARMRIVEPMSAIRKKLFNNAFLLQHNIEYGAMRNAVGGSVIGSIISICNLIFFYKIHPNYLALILSSMLLSIFLLLIIFSKSIIYSYGSAYAKILFREYINET